jgi:hypothetical protein
MTAAIRTAIPAGALIALLLGIFLPANHDLPAVALGNRELLWAERSFLFFYGYLLLFVPLVRALHGELPIELSTRGARYAETSEVVIEELKGAAHRSRGLCGRNGRNRRRLGRADYGLSRSRRS